MTDNVYLNNNNHVFIFLTRDTSKQESSPNSNRYQSHPSKKGQQTMSLTFPINKSHIAQGRVFLPQRTTTTTTKHNDDNEGQRSTTKHNEAQRRTTKHNEGHRSTTKDNEAQRRTTKHNEDNEAQRRTTKHNEGQRSTTKDTELQSTTTNYNSRTYDVRSIRSYELC